MQTNDVTITTISEDVTQIVKNAYGENFELHHLCKDHHNPILFYDKKPVLEITQDDCIGIFALNSNHYFLSSRDAFRLGNYCKLPLSGIIALMLKAEWEQIFVETVGNKSWNDNNWNSKIKNKKQIQEFIAEFQPDSGEIINLFIRTKANPDGFYQDDFIGFVINDLIAETTFLMDNKSVCNLYPEKGHNEKALLYSIQNSEKEKYLNLKNLWKIKSNELEELLLLFERKKRIYINLENKYYRLFGYHELIKSRLNQQKEKYQIIYEILKNCPEYPYRKLLKLAEERMSKTDKKGTELRNLITRSKNCWDEIFGSESASYITNEFKEKYTASCKKLLKKIYFLLHPDSPDYHKLSKQKKERLNEMWLLLMKTTKDEFYSYTPNMLLYHLPDYEKLESIYKSACRILSITPEYIEPGDRLEFMIRKGTPIKGMTEFLENEIKGLDYHLAYLEISQDEYTHEEQAQYYRSALEDINDHEERLRNEIRDLKSGILSLKQSISNGLLKTAK